ncbi:hypothetical protein F2Q69_00038169 [Brassica cretica]|uniref:Uncharacterized protein n=1 Tax=Brassica cretica TaxID=69181 RepID=A0A8S9SFE4_BRACR|nr:hypothetical protein F2Q69_00038169 [Brassica cretica]
MDDLSPFATDDPDTVRDPSQLATDVSARSSSRPVPAHDLSNVPARNLPLVRGPFNPIGG